MPGAIFGARFDQFVQNQIDQRQRRMMGSQHIKFVNTEKNSEGGTDYTYKLLDDYNSRETFYRQTCMVRLMSGINIDDDSEPAQRYILYSTQFAEGKTVENEVFNSDLLKFTTGISPNLDEPSLASYGFLSNKNYGYVPPPGIVSVDIKALNRGSLKEANINILCHSKDQFDTIDKLYLRLGYTMVLDWGWTQYENNDGTLGRLDKSAAFTKIPILVYSGDYRSSDFYKPFIEGNSVINYLRKETSGNYDIMVGRVVNYTWSLEKDGSYNITLTLRSLGDIIESLKANSSHQPTSKTQPTYSSDEKTEDQPALEYDKLKSSLNRILWYFAETFASDSSGASIKSSKVTGPSEINSGADLTANQNLPAETSDMDLASFAFPSLEGIERNYGGSTSNYQYYVRLGCLLRVMCDYLLLYDDKGNSILNINYDNNDNFMLTYPRHGSLDPRICLIPIIAKLNETEQELPEEDKKEESTTPSKYDYIDTVYTWNTIRVLPYGDLANGQFNDYHNGPWENVKQKDGWPILSGKVYMTDNEGEYDHNHNFKINDDDREDNNAEVYDKIIEAIKAEVKPRLTGDQIEWGDLNLFDIDHLYYNNEGKKDKSQTPDLDVLNAIRVDVLPKQEWTGGDTIWHWDNVYPDQATRILNDCASDAEKLWHNYYQQLCHRPDGPRLSEVQINGILGKYITIDPGLYPNDIEYYPAGNSKSTSTTKEITYLNGNNKILFTIVVYEHQAVFRQFVDKNTNLTGADILQPDVQGEEKVTDVKTNAYVKYINKNSKFRTNGDFVGRTMEIMVNMNYVAKTLEDYIDIKTGDISIFDFLEKLMSGIQNALGSINSFNITYDENNHQFKIVDSTFIPGLGKVQPNYFTRTPAKFVFDLDDIRDYHTGNYVSTSNNKMRSSFVRDFSIKTKLSNNFAAMTTIGAQANGNVVGENATALSKWNEGLKDRLNPTKTNKNDPQADQPIDDSYLTNCGILQVLNDGVNDGNITNEQIDRASNPSTDLFKFELGKYVNDNKINPIGFLPIDLELTIDGMSGIKIYEIFDVDDKYLPTTYSSSIQFITTGVSHRIQNNDWVTVINSICGPKYDPFAETAAPPPKQVKIKYGKTVKKGNENGGDINVGSPAKGNGDIARLTQWAGPEIKDGYWQVIQHHNEDRNTKTYNADGNHQWRVNHIKSKIITGYIPTGYAHADTIRTNNSTLKFGVWDFVQNDYLKDSYGNPTSSTTTDVNILSPFSGTVRRISAGNNGGAGNWVAVYGDNGESAVFFHFRDYLVTDGQKVSQGTPLGIQGNTGASRGVHTHVEGMLPDDFAKYINYLLSLKSS